MKLTINLEPVSSAQPSELDRALLDTSPEAHRWQVLVHHDGLGQVLHTGIAATAPEAWVAMSLRVRNLLAR